MWGVSPMSINKIRTVLPVKPDPLAASPAATVVAVVCEPTVEAEAAATRTEQQRLALNPAPPSTAADDLRPVRNETMAPSCKISEQPPPAPPKEPATEARKVRFKSPAYEASYVVVTPDSSVKVN